jgi:hypothetical protein
MTHTLPLSSLPDIVIIIGELDELIPDSEVVAGADRSSPRIVMRAFCPPVVVRAQHFFY